MRTSALIARYLSRYRGTLLGGVGSAAAIAVTLDPASTLARSSVAFALAFAAVGTLLMLLMTAMIEIAERLASRPVLPRAIVRRRASRV